MESLKESKFDKFQAQEISNSSSIKGGADGSQPTSAEVDTHRLGQPTDHLEADALDKKKGR